MHQYWGFGLNIESEIAFPELLPASFSQAHVTVRIGKAPAALAGEDVVRSGTTSISPAEYLLKIENTAYYYAARGRTVIIEPSAGADEESVRLFMLSNAMAAILHQQGRIPLHASGIVTGDGLVLFTGPSGIGKSTTAYGLMQQGFTLFTDDVCVLERDNTSGEITAVASYPMLKLWENTMDLLPAEGIQKNYRVRYQLPKFGVFHHEHFSTEKLPVKRVFILDNDNGIDGFVCREPGKVEAFNLLQQNTYRRHHVDMMQLHQPHFDIIAGLTNQAQVLELRRAPGTDIAAYLEFIKAQLGAPKA